VDAVIKVGGNLAEDPATLKTLCNRLSEIAKKYSIVVVPGGGKLADVVREFDQRYALSADISHRMAILGMDQFGLFLSQIIPNSCATYLLSDTVQLSEIKVVPIFLPSRLMFREDPLEPSWNVTSDSIAAYVANRLKADKVILVTDVDGIFTSDPKKHADAKLITKLSASELLKLARRTSVDQFLPKLLLKTRLDCYVVNGAYPERIEAILAGQHAVCTLVKSQMSSSAFM
jgi:aspartokinase-like uncharacterized kinase